MPQLDVSTYPSQLFWLALSFFVLYNILSYVAIPKIGRFISERAEAIDGKLREATILREEAELLLDEYEKILADARLEARHRYMAVASDVSKKMAKQQKEMLQNITERLRHAEQEIYRSKVAVLKELKPTAVDIAQDILLRITGHKLNKTVLKAYQEKS